MKPITVAILGGAVLASAGYFLGTQQSTSEPNRLGVPTYEAGGEDRDCGDFSTHAQAQAFFEASGSGDPHGLDGDDDGEACESLP